MKHIAWTKRKATLTLTLCAIIATSTIIILQNTQTTQAALIDPHPGLVGWWRFDEGNGNLAKDSSGYGNDGSIYGNPVWVNGAYGKGLSFDGTGDYVSMNSVPTQIQGNKDFSIEFWANPYTAKYQAWTVVFGDSAENKGYHIAVSQNSIIFGYWGHGISKYESFSGLHHYVFVRNGAS